MNERTNFGHQEGVELKKYLEAKISALKTLIEANDRNYVQRFENVVEVTKSALAAAGLATDYALGNCIMYE